jgi:uncharacterized OsmC-like protein
LPKSRVNPRELQAPIKERYRVDPENATVTMTVRSTGADLSDPLHCAVSPDSVGDVLWRSGTHPAAGGVGDVPCSADLLLGALVACQEVTLRMVAAAMGIELESVEVTASGTMDFRGTLGMSREVPVGLSRIECATHVVAKDDGRPEFVQRLLENAERYCVVLDTLRRGVPVKSSFSAATTT